MDAVRKPPRGTLVDGELVVLREGRADLDAILRRHQANPILPGQEARPAN
jgi:hypothetical protein